MICTSSDCTLCTSLWHSAPMSHWGSFITVSSRFLLSSRREISGGNIIMDVCVTSYCQGSAITIWDRMGSSIPCILLSGVASLLLVLVTSTFKSIYLFYFLFFFVCFLYKFKFFIITFLNLSINQSILFYIFYWLFLLT